MLGFMLDTNIIIYIMRNKPAVVREAFKKHSDALCISSVAYSELMYGAEKSSKVQQNLSLLEGFVSRLDVLAFDAAAACHAGQIRAELAARGEPIGPYDVLIAGHARSRGLVLVTNNEREFQRVDGLRVKNWLR